MLATRLTVLSLLVLGLQAAPTANQQEEDALASIPADALASENEMLKLRLNALQNALKEEKKWAYVVVKGYISGAENVFMETMDVDTAKQYCNAHAECQGFTFNGPDERP